MWNEKRSTPKEYSLGRNDSVWGTKSGATTDGGTRGAAFASLYLNYGKAVQKQPKQKIRANKTLGDWHKATGE